MAKRKTYEAEAIKLAKAIDFALEAFRVESPSAWDLSQVEHVILCYKEWKDSCLNPAAQFKKLSSLQYLENDVFTYFNESTGPTVEYFWNKIKEDKLDFQRENKLDKIIRRGKIRGRIEYDYVKDLIGVAGSSGLISNSEIIKLNLMIGEFEFSI